MAAALYITDAQVDVRAVFLLAGGRAELGGGRRITTYKKETGSDVLRVAQLLRVLGGWGCRLNRVHGHGLDRRAEDAGLRGGVSG